MLKKQTLILLAVSLPALASLGFSQDESSSDAEVDFNAPERQTALKIQLFLDSEGFGPGRLDAWWGEFTKKAAARWNEANSDRKIEMTDSGDPDPSSVDKLGWSKPLVTEYTITDKDSQQVGELPEEPEKQAEQDRMPYTSLMELVAEKFHAYPEFVRELNDLEESAGLSVGQTVKVPNVAEPFDLSGPKEASSSSGTTDGEIFINRSEEILEYRSGGKIVHSFPITPGASSNPAPPGDWKVETVAWMPTFRYDKKMLEEGERSDEAYILPPGPNNPVGIIWMGIDSDGIGMHGTSAPDSIGRSSSHGCIRLANWDAYTLGQKVAVNTKVHIE